MPAHFQDAKLTPTVQHDNCLQVVFHVLRSSHSSEQEELYGESNKIFLFAIYQLLRLTMEHPNARSS